MAIERVSAATLVDGDKKIIQTDETALLAHMEASNEELADGYRYSLTDLVIGKNNVEIFNDIVKNQIHTPDTDLATALRYFDETREWREVIIARELAARAIEVSLYGDFPLGGLKEALVEVSSGTRYDTHKRLSSSPINIKQFRSVAERALAAGWSLGDDIAKERLAAEITLLLKARSLAFMVEDYDKSKTARLVLRNKSERKRRELFDAYMDAPDEDVLRADLGILSAEADVDAVRTENLPGDVAVQYAAVKSLIERLKNIRQQALGYALPTKAVGQYTYFPSNIDVYKPTNTEVLPQERESITVVSGGETPEERQRRIGAQEQKRRAAQQAAQEATALKLRQDMEHDQPIIELLNGTSLEYNRIIDQFIGQSSKSLREVGILGKDSLEYHLRQSKHIDPSAVIRTVRVYTGLRAIATEHGDDALEAYGDKMAELERLLATHIDILEKTPLKRKNGYEALKQSITPELAWLRENWEEFLAYMDNSAHKAFVSDDQLRVVARLLGVVETEENDKNQAVVEGQATEVANDDEELSSNEVNKSSLNALEEANRLAEQLNWVVLPDEEITADELVEVARKTLCIKSKGKPATIERYRMEALLALRQEFGGTLYRSDERTLGDSDNLYFVLRFQHPGDDNMYAVAENPVYGNATYVLREDALPLAPGESVLSVVRLSRHDVRDFGAKRIVHGAPHLETHLNKISDNLVELSKQDSVASNQ